MSDPSQPAAQRPRGRVALYAERDGSRTLRALVRLPGASGGRVEVIAVYRPGAGPGAGVAAPLAETRVVLLPQPAPLGQRVAVLDEVRRLCAVEAGIAERGGGCARVGMSAGEWREVARRVEYSADVWRAEMTHAS